MLNVAGHRIGTAEIENAIIKLDFVAETAAIGVPDEIKGDAIYCFVSMKND